MSLDVTLTYELDGNTVVVFDANVTHNLAEMAGEAGLYTACWKPEELDVEFAHQLVGYLELGLSHLKANPVHYKTFNPPNGWGDYDGFVEWVEKYLEACKKFPSANVDASR